MSRFMSDDWVLPVIDRVNCDFFTAGRLVIQECTSCGTVQHPPGEICYQCHESDFRSRAVDGRGTVYSYTVVHHPLSPVLAKLVPYAVALVSLDEIPEIRILGNVIDVPASAVHIGLKVRVTFEEADDPDGGRLLQPQWRAAEVDLERPTSPTGASVS